HAPDRVPGGGRLIADAEGEPAVPGKVLELHGADKYRRMQARQRIVADVFDPGGELDVDVFALDRVAGDDFSAITGEQRDEIALEIDALHQPREIAGLEASEIGFDSLSSGWFVGGRGQQTVGVQPAGSHPRRREPTVHGEHRGIYERGRVDLVDLRIPIRIAGGPIRMALCKGAARR